MNASARSFRVGKVHGYLRGRIWYLYYHDNGRRVRPRVGPEREAARQLAAQINGQLAVGAPAALSFEPISIPQLRQRWLEHHEQVRRSSIQTIGRYRAATEHMLRFLEQHPVRHASQFHPSHAAAFVSYLRTLAVSPNGHAHTPKRRLMDKGLRYILECCRALFNFAAKHRHLSPYADNPFRALDIDRIPQEEARPITLFTPEQETAFFQACDDWQLPLFLTLALTGLRPGEVTHLLLPDDLDLQVGILHVRNKAKLGWQVKTRSERAVPLLPQLALVLRVHLQGRQSGLVFLRRCYNPGETDSHENRPRWEKELDCRIAALTEAQGTRLSRLERLREARKFWREHGCVREDRVRLEFMRLTRRIGLAGQTAPKVLRHQFATALQEANVDPLIRNQLMGHAASGERSAGHGLGMTAVYTHTRPETVRRQLEAALAGRPGVAAATAWLVKKGASLPG